MAVSENKYLRYALTQNLGKDAADKILEILAATGTTIYESGGTTLTLGAVSAGQFLKRSGSTLIGSAAGGTAFTAVKTGDYTAVAGELVLVNASGGNVSVTLPSSPSDNDQVGVFATHAPGANAVTIVGTVSNAQHDKKLHVIGDYMAFQYSSTLSAWVTTACDLTPHSASVTLSSAITTNTAATAKKVTFDTEAYDVGACFDAATNNRFVAKRAGKYMVTYTVRPNGNLGTSKYFLTEIRVNNSAVSTFRYLSASMGSNNMSIANSCVVNLAATDYVEGFFTAEDANMGVGNGATDTLMTVTELRQ